MKIKYFQETDTLYIEFRTVEAAETKDLDENTLLDLDQDGNICGLTIEHASDRADICPARNMAGREAVARQQCLRAETVHSDHCSSDRRWTRSACL